MGGASPRRLRSSGQRESRRDAPPTMTHYTRNQNPLQLNEYPELSQLKPVEHI